MSVRVIVCILLALAIIYRTIRSMIRGYKIAHEKRAYVRFTILIILQFSLILLLLLSAYDMVIQELGYPQLRILYPFWATHFCQ